MGTQVAPHSKGVIKGGSEALRTAEALFESKSISDIREVEKRTRKDVDVKKHQLRQLVGDSYRDLIESADKIVSISTICDHALRNVKGIQGGFTLLAHSFSSSDNILNEKRESLTKHEELHAIGTRVKYIVDTPEVIWGCLDSNQFLEASRRFLRAHQVHSLLFKSFSEEALAKFPLLTHQWPLVEKFRKQILDAVQSILSSDGTLSTELAAEAVAAAAALQPLDSMSALQMFLDSRRALIVQPLAMDEGNSPGDVAMVVTKFSKFVQSVQATLSQVGELFLARTQTTDTAAASASGTCLLQATMREEDADASELLFSGQGSILRGAAQGAAGALQAPEAEAWRHAIKRMLDGLVALTSGQVEKACMAWLKMVSLDLEVCAEPLLQTCSTAAMLIEVEAGVHHAIAGWKTCSPSTGGVAGVMSYGVPTVKRSLNGASTIQSALLLSGTCKTRQTKGESWDSICEWILGFPLNLWQELFHVPFLLHCKHLLSSCLTDVGRTLEQPLQECLDTAGQESCETPGHVIATLWPLLPQQQKPLSGGMLRQDSTYINGSVMHTWSDRAIQDKIKMEKAVEERTGFRQRIHSIRQRFDDELLSTLQSMLLLLSPQGPQGHSGISSGARPLDISIGSSGNKDSLSEVRADSVGIQSRASVLEPFFQDKCAEMVAMVASNLQSCLDRIGCIYDGATGTAAAERALLLGRLCSGLACESKLLPVLLGPSDMWAAAGRAGTGQVRSSGLRGHGHSSSVSARPGPGSIRLQQVVDSIYSTSLSAYKQWASWAASSLSAQLRDDLTQDDLMAATSTPLSWQEVVVSMNQNQSGGADGAAALLMSSSVSDTIPMSDMRFWLPACPSASCLSFLQAACQEVRRAGDHATTAEALQIFEWEMSGAALKVVADLLSDPDPAPVGSLTLDSPLAPSMQSASFSSRLTEKGVLQLLLDVRTIRDVLAGGRPLCVNTVPGSTPDIAGAAPSSGGGAALLGSSGSGLRPFMGSELQDPAIMAAVASRRREGLRLEQQMQDRLDPIDWATYEPYFWSNVQRHSQRVAILFGTLLQLQRGMPDSNTRQPSGAPQNGSSCDVNPLNLIPVAPRFQYLPISAPSMNPTVASASSHSSSPRRRSPSSLGLMRTLTGSAASSALGSHARPFVPVASAASSDLAALFSFVDLGSDNSRVQGSVGNGLGEDPGSSTISSLQAKLQAGSLSTFLGDKAAEMTLMAQQRFDNIADFTAFGSGLLSSLTKTVTK